MIDYIDVIAKNPIFNGLTYDEIFTFLNESDYYIKEFTVFDNIKVLKNYVMVLLKGTIRSVYIDENGNSTDTNIFHYLDENIIMKGIFTDRFQEELIVLESSVVMYISHESFFNNNSVILNKIYKNTILSFEFALQKSNIVAVLNAQKSVKDKLKLYVDYQLNPPHGLAPFSLTKKEVSDMMNIDYTSLSKEIKKLSDKIPNINSLFNKTHGIKPLNINNRVED